MLASDTADCMDVRDKMEAVGALTVGRPIVGQLACERSEDALASELATNGTASRDSRFPPSLKRPFEQQRHGDIGQNRLPLWLTREMIRQARPGTTKAAFFVLSVPSW